MKSRIFCLEAGHFEIVIEALKPPRQGCVDGQKLHIAQHQDDEPRWCKPCLWYMKKCKKVG